MSTTTPVAARVERAATLLLGAPPPLRFRAWDGSSAGAADAPAVVLRSATALHRLVWSAGELGLARAYVAGDLDVEGDLRTALGGLAFEHDRMSVHQIVAVRPGPLRLTSS